jgi:ligand-binding sensor domain-containing protein/signal transduction histidine kinase
VLLLIFRTDTLSSGFIHSINKQHAFDYITIDDGLSINLVTKIRKDAYGYIWFGTSNGVNRYDGYSVFPYLNIDGDSTSLIKNTVFSLFLDSKDRFWIGTNGGLCYYDYNKDNFIRKAFVLNDTLSNPFIGAMCEDKNGIIWVGTSVGLIAMNVETLESEHFPVEDAGKQGNTLIMSMLLESDSILNIGTFNTGYFRYNIRKKNYRQYVTIPGDGTSVSENSIEIIYQDLDGNIWIGTNNQGMNIFDPETESFTRILVDETNERSKRVRSIIQDGQSRFWFGTRNGLYTKSGAGNDKIVQYAHTGHLVSKLNNNSIYDIYIDTSGIMWLGTYAGGVNYTNLNKEKFYHFKYFPNNSQFLNNEIVQCFAEDKEGNLWIGTENGGLNVFNKKTGRYSYYMATGEENSLSANNVKCLAFDDNNGLWIGTYRGGLDYLNLKENKFYHYRYQDDNENSIADNTIYSLLYDSNRKLWIGTNKGLCLLNPENKKIKRFSIKKDFLRDINSGTFYNFSVPSILEDKEGNIYVGMMSFGLFQFQKKDSLFVRMNIHEYFNPQVFFKDSKNNLWMGTNAGLFLIDDFTNSVYTKFSDQSGLASNNIYGILEDEASNLWISTSAGLVKFTNAVNDPHLPDFTIYDRSDGLQSNQFVTNAALKREDGQMFFGGINGYNAFYPDSLKENDFIPPVYINEFLIFNKPVPVGTEGSPLQKVIEHTDEIVISWKQSVFSLGFIAISYAHPEKNLYAYKMEGFDQDWTYTDASRRLATYTNLDPGHYTFHVKASNNDGKWNEKGASIRVTIQPPVWQTWWFRTGLIGTIALLMYSGLSIKLKRDRDRRRILEGMVEKRTNQLETLNKELEAFAYSVSHDLRTPLRGIDGFSQILLTEYKENMDAQGQDYLTRIRTATQRMDHLISDLLNLSRISRTPIRNQRVDISRLASQIADEIRVGNPERIVRFIIQKGIIVSADERLLRIVLENLLGNAWKFTSKKDQACIEFGKMDEKEQPVYFVRDDGAGFEMNYMNKLFGAFQRLHTTNEFPGTGIGLATVQRIIRRHGGNVWAEGEVDKGATFYFTIH